MKKTKTLFKILCTVICTLTFTNCQENVIQENDGQITSQKYFPFISSSISQKNVEANTKLSNQIRNLATLQSSNIPESLYADLYDFSVNVDVVNFVESTENESHSYTFSINRDDNEENVLENLVFSYDANIDNYIANLVTYHFTSTQKQEFVLTKHTSGSYDVSFTNIPVNLSDLIGENSLEIPCITNFTVYHITPDTGETFLYSSTNGNIQNVCEHESDDDPCQSYTIVELNCKDGGSANASSSGSSPTTSGGGTSSNINSPPPNTDVVTLPNIDLGSWLIDALNVSNFDTEGQIIWDWIENNYSLITLSGNDDIFLDVYEFYTDNMSVSNIDNIVKEVILNLDADPSLTFEEALLEANIIIVEPGQPKVDPAVELSCFDLTQGAKLTVYVQQPKENSSALVGPNQVGHAFIGIEQGGIVRQIGYYPNKEVGPTGVGTDFEAAIKTNYDYLYHVSISQNISSEQLTNIVNYSINFPPTYNTNNYACADFAINIGNLGGMNLPSTTVSSFLFTGRSPGVLGQQIRAMSSTSTTTISTVRANSPTRQGGCIDSN